MKIKGFSNMFFSIGDVWKVFLAALLICFSIGVPAAISDVSKGPAYLAPSVPPSPPWRSTAGDTIASGNVLESVQEQTGSVIETVEEIGVKPAAIFESASSDMNSAGDGNSTSSSNLTGGDKNKNENFSISQSEAETNCREQTFLHSCANNAHVDEACDLVGNSCLCTPTGKDCSSGTQQP